MFFYYIKLAEWWRGRKNSIESNPVRFLNHFTLLWDSDRCILGGKTSALWLDGRAKWHRLIPQCLKVWSVTPCHAELVCCNTDITKLSQDSMSLLLCDSVHGNICWCSLCFGLQGRTVSFVPFAQHAVLRLTFHEHYPAPARVTDLTWKRDNTSYNCRSSAGMY